MLLPLHKNFKRKINHKLSLQNSKTVGKHIRTEEYKEKFSKTRAKFIYEVIKPSGEIFTIHSLHKLARNTGLDRGSLQYHIKKKTNNHKGWKVSIKEKKNE